MDRSEILRAFAAEPWAILPSALATMQARLAALPDQPTEADLAALRIEAAVPSRAIGQVAVIPVYGVISQRASFWSLLFGGTSTEEIAARIRQYAADETISGIVLDMDSPGGSVSGVPELAAAIYAARDSKPIVAIANTMMASAAYWIGSQASEIIASPSAILGSIGVISTHIDYSGALAQEGVVVTHITAGKYKAEGSPYFPLDAEAQAALQALVDDFYALFVADVAKGRDVPVADVRGGFGEGRVVTAKDAVKLGMADRVGTLPDATARAVGRRSLRAEDGTPPIAGRSNDSYRALARTLT